MSWHDDGEPGLGPVVASLSLGSTATMEWRIKSDRVAPNTGYYNGHEGKKPSRHARTALSITLSHGVSHRLGNLTSGHYHHERGIYPIVLQTPGSPPWLPSSSNSSCDRCVTMHDTFDLRILLTADRVAWSERVFIIAISIAAILQSDRLRQDVSSAYARDLWCGGGVCSDCDG